MKIRNLCLIIIQISIVIQIAYGNEILDSADVQQEIITAENALKRAIAYTGFSRFADNRLDSSNRLVNLVTIVDTTTPFLSEKINGRTAWIVDFNDIVLDSDNILEEYRSRRIKNFRVAIDAETGQLLRVTGIILERNHESIAEPNAKMAEKQLRGDELYHGLPTVLPAIKFFDAINSVPKYSVLAKEVIGTYILHSGNGTGQKPRAIWCITFRGHPFKTMGVGIKLTSWRILVDPITGKILFESSRPALEGN